MPIRLYPWTDWFAGRHRHLRRGREYVCSTVNMAQCVRNEASRRGLRVSVTETVEGLLVVVTGKRRSA